MRILLWFCLLCSMVVGLSCGLRTIDLKDFPCRSDAVCSQGLVCIKSCPTCVGRCLPPGTSVPSEPATEPALEPHTDASPPQGEPEPPESRPEVRCPNQQQEVCNDKDDDCDGQIDENLTRACPYKGPAKAVGVGICQAATQRCTKGAWGQCQGEQLPVQEVCGNGKDDDCDGQVDNWKLCGGLATQTCADGGCVIYYGAMIQGGDGSIYVTGSYYGHPRFFGVKLRQAEGTNDGFVAKFGPSGRLKWVQVFGGAQSNLDTRDREGGRHLMLASDGALYLSGTSYGDATFGDKLVKAPVKAKGSGDAFIARLDTSGKFEWVRLLTGGGLDKGFQLVEGPKGLIYWSGYFSRSALADPYLLKGSGINDLFVAKLNTKGIFLWVTTFSNKDYFSPSREGSLLWDKRGFLWVLSSGTKKLPIYANGTPYGQAGSTNSRRTVFAKVDEQGKVLDVYIKETKGSATVTSALQDAQGALYLAGFYMGEMEWGGKQVGGLPDMKSNQLFVVKFDANLVFQWFLTPQHHKAHGSQDVFQLAEGPSGSIHLVGSFYGGFLALTNTIDQKGFGGRDGFIASCSKEGAWTSLKVGGGRGNDAFRALLLSAEGQPLVGGYYQWSVRFGDFGTTSQSNDNNEYGLFLWRWKP